MSEAPPLLSIEGLRTHFFTNDLSLIHI